MLHVLHVNHSGSEVFEIVHYQLFLVRYKDSYSMLLTKQFKASLRHLCLLLNLLEAREVQRVLQLLEGSIKVHTFLLDLIPKDLDLLLETFNTILLLHDFMISFLF